jgi:N-acetylglucosamine malate deacetylase 1
MSRNFLFDFEKGSDYIPKSPAPTVLRRFSSGAPPAICDRAGTARNCPRFQPAFAGCGGTIAFYTDLGNEVILLYLNNGEWPAEKGGASASIRMAEASKACQILTARPAYAGQLNGHAVLDSSHFDEYRKILEAERPDVVLTQWPIDNHRDHRATSALTYDAWVQMGRSFALYYYEVSNGEDTLQFSPTHYVDITKTEPRKRAACYAHASATPDRFYELQDHVAKFRGIESGYKRAEAFILQVQSPYQALPTASLNR